MQAVLFVMFLLFVKGTVVFAGSEVCTFKVLCAECTPASGTEDFLFGNIVKSNGDAEH